MVCENERPKPVGVLPPERQIAPEAGEGIRGAGAVATPTRASRFRWSNGSPGWGTKSRTLLRTGRWCFHHPAAWRTDSAARAWKEARPGELGEIAAPGAPLFPLGPRDSPAARSRPPRSSPSARSSASTSDSGRGGPRRRLRLNGRGQREERQQRQQRSTRFIGRPLAAWGRRRCLGERAATYSFGGPCRAGCAYRSGMMSRPIASAKRVPIRSAAAAGGSNSARARPRWRRRVKYG